MPADKDHIIREIRRTAKANGGVALGWRRFEEETGIRYYDWYGQHWTRWGDAVREAGFEPNRMSEAYDDGFLLDQLASLTRRLAILPDHPPPRTPIGPNLTASSPAPGPSRSPGH